ncbi:hypothetical protein ABW19_dt0201897 [Dactylella cylindrospora]|nr:hypothetical protein ABW19_dt0201897 [Dactylella cylindrospora]
MRCLFYFLTFLLWVVNSAQEQEAPNPRASTDNGSESPSTAWTETITRNGSVVVLVHPHKGNYAFVETGQGTGSEEGGVASMSASSESSLALSTTPDIATSLRSSSASASSGPLGLQSGSSSTSYNAENNIASSSVQPTTLSTPSSSRETSPPSTAPQPAPKNSSGDWIYGAFESVSSFDLVGLRPTALHTSSKFPLDSAEAIGCTGGSYHKCIESYDCHTPESETVQCYCRNNVRQGCNESCGGNHNPEVEKCPLLPVSPMTSTRLGPGGDDFDDDLADWTPRRAGRREKDFMTRGIEVLWGVRQVANFQPLN